MLEIFIGVGVAGLFITLVEGYRIWKHRDVRELVERKMFDNSAEAIQLRGKPVQLPTRWLVKDGEKRRIVAWDIAGPQIEGEQALIGSGLNILHAEGFDLSDNDPAAIEQAARRIALWWHGLEEDDVEGE